MKIFKKENVYDDTLDRIRYIFDEFEDVVVCFSGGKDSTVIYELAMKIAKEKNRLPLNVMFLDQEAEWQCTIDYVKTVMYNPLVKPYWLQVPFRLFNASNHDNEWLECWGESEKDLWIREKDPIAIKENIYGTDRFKSMFDRFIEVTFPNKKVARIGGVRCEESPARFLALTAALTYKHITWGTKHIKGTKTKKTSCLFSPLYDWSYTDIWKSIHDNNWDYCKLYDYMYQHGQSIQNMRVSSITHELALNAVGFLQEVERDTWNRVSQRVKGLNTIKHLGLENQTVKELPFMFDSWQEYRDYLADELLSGESQAKFKAEFARMDKDFLPIGEISGYFKTCVMAIIRNDHYFTTFRSFMAKAPITSYIKYIRGKPLKSAEHLKYVHWYRENVEGIKNE